MYFVYILKCSDGSLYTGIAKDLKARLAMHANGKGARYTRSRLPVVVVYSEHKKTKSSALKREAAIKKLSRAEKRALLSKEKIRAKMVAQKRHRPELPSSK